MTYFGHTLTGMAIVVCVMPRPVRARSKIAHLVCFGLLANVPDFRFPGWGHDAYAVSHSLFVNLGLMVLVGVCILLARRWKLRVPLRIHVAGSIAWLSHLLLDSMYNHGQGIAIFWPFSAARLVLPVPLFATLRGSLSPLDGHTLRVYAIEVAVYGTLFAAVWSIRAAREKRPCNKTVKQARQ